MTPQEEEQYRARQKSRARVMALLLGAFVILMFAISIAKIKAGMTL
jgi:cytochrome c oxidase assembly protein Cox11